VVTALVLASSSWERSTDCGASACGGAGVARWVFRGSCVTDRVRGCRACGLRGPVARCGRCRCRRRGGRRSARGTVPLGRAERRGRPGRRPDLGGASRRFRGSGAGTPCCGGSRTERRVRTPSPRTGPVSVNERVHLNCRELFRGRSPATSRTRLITKCDVSWPG